MKVTMTSIRFCTFGLIALLAITPTRAMVGGAPPAADGAGRSVVMILGSGGTACTATAIARDLLLTAAHCVQPDSEYKLAASAPGERPVLKDITRIERDPQFDLKRLFGHLATADVALIKLAELLPAKIPPVPLGAEEEPVAVGDAFVVAGYGVTVRGDAGRHRPARRLANPAVRSEDQGRQPRAGRLRRRFRRAGVSRQGRPQRHHRRGELVDRPETRGRLRRADRRHAARTLPRLDPQHRAYARLTACALARLRRRLGARIKYRREKSRMSRSAWIMSLVLWPLAAAAQPASGDQTMLGMRLFNQSCRVCHTKPQLVSPQYGPVLSMNTLGGKADVMRDVISNGTPRMPGFKYHFKPAEIDAIVAYIKTIPAPSDAPPPVKAGSSRDAD
jgi:mono/diheme cytochrome c family protein